MTTETIKEINLIVQTKLWNMPEKGIYINLPKWHSLLSIRPTYLVSSHEETKSKEKGLVASVLIDD